MYFQTAPINFLVLSLKCIKDNSILTGTKLSFRSSSANFLPRFPDCLCQKTWSYSSSFLSYSTSRLSADPAALSSKCIQNSAFRIHPDTFSTSTTKVCPDRQYFFHGLLQWPNKQLVSFSLPCLLFNLLS